MAEAEKELSQEEAKRKILELSNKHDVPVIIFETRKDAEEMLDSMRLGERVKMNLKQHGAPYERQILQ